MEETSLEVLLDLWVVLFGEDVLWNDASALARSNDNIETWYQALTQKGLLKTDGINGRIHIRVVKGGAHEFD